MNQQATVFGIGVGPGDPELVTLKAYRILQQVKVVAYPAPDTGDSFARRIISPHLTESKIELPIRMPIGDGSYPKASIYEAAADAILLHIKDGRSVAVLCEGDPLFYGSFAYLHHALADRCPMVIVPGVSSVMACAAMAQRPLALKNTVFTVLPANAPASHLSEILSGDQAVAIIKTGRRLPMIRDALSQAGRQEQSWVVVHATLPDQVSLPLDQWPDDHLPYFAVILSPGRTPS